MRWWIFWTVLIVFAAWWDRQQSAQVWRVHRPVRKIERTVHIKPIVFENASVLWLNTLSDEIDLKLRDVSHGIIGSVDIEKLQMHVYNDRNRTDVAEIYEMDYSTFASGVWEYNFLQTDIHLSPFRRLFVFPTVNWTLGSGTCEWCFPRRGYFYKGWWVEPKTWRWTPWVIVWGMGLLIYRKCFVKVVRGRQVRFT